MALIDPDEEPGAAAGQALPEWYAQLLDRGELDTAIEFLCHALPRYECLVWATRALLEIRAVERSDPLIVAVLRWIDDPDDAKRRAAAQAGETVKKMNAAQLLCEATFLSGGSMAPEHLPAVQPPPDACAKLASGAILLGAYALDDPVAAKRKALALGEAIVTRQ
ncbi:DUF6931 family protein [Novosphingobium album (ex Liu et al. 2023)]|nr:hypothetical protein [Novosphingobium album (ex Liu et al. 2023)]